MNVLISCVGRQGLLIQWFREALQGEGLVFAIDHDAQASGLSQANQSLSAPAFSSNRYPDWILDLCRKEKISLLLTLHEEDLLILESIRNPLSAAGCHLVGVNPNILRQTRDKFLSTTFLHGKGPWEIPPTFPLSWEAEIKSTLSQVPSLIKPRLGRGSRGIRRCDEWADFLRIRDELEEPDQWIIQPWLQGEDFNFDIINDLSGRYQTCFVRRKLRSGKEEIAEAETIRDSCIEHTAESLSQLIGHQGCLDVDAIRVEKTLYLLDLNIRFGGSYCFSHFAGANLPAAYLAWARGRKPKPSWLQPRPGLRFSREQFTLPPSTPSSFLL